MILVNDFNLSFWLIIHFTILCHFNAWLIEIMDASILLSMLWNSKIWQQAVKACATGCLERQQSFKTC